MVGVYLERHFFGEELAHFAVQRAERRGGAHDHHACKL